MGIPGKATAEISSDSFACEMSMFFFTGTKVNEVQTRETSQSLSKVFIKPWKWTGETALPGNSPT